MESELTNAILRLRDEFVYHYDLKSYDEINNGLCVDFAETIDGEIEGCGLLSNDFLVIDIDSGWNGNYEDDWSLEALLSYNSQPPIDVEALKIAVPGYHRWIYYNQKHYDATCPNGVENLFDLPFFQSHLKRYQTSL